MNLDFHYYTTYYLALKAKWQERDAKILSYSCQFTDNNVVAYRVSHNKKIYDVEPTQNYGFWNPDTPERVYLPFHFFPGGAPSNPLAVVPNSPGVKELLVQALKGKNLYEIGMALHTFADTYAHQNFSGIREKGNALDPKSLIPPIGHAQALKLPDQWNLSWTDSRLEKEKQRISNRERFRACAKKIYRYLCLFQGVSYAQEEWILDDWEALMDTGQEAMEFRLLGIETYDRTEWFKEALLSTPALWEDESLFQGYDKVLWLADELFFKSRMMIREPLAAHENWENTHFFRWQEASKVHRTRAYSILDRLVPGWKKSL